jgi:pyruvate/2-oxoglutarate dehydrogenase complex dihydrolipoamide acyltransferase (E2) component
VRHTLKLPKLGDTADEVVITEWYVVAGAFVAAGDPLLRVETDKVEVDVMSPLAGVLVEQLVQPDDEIRTGSAYAIVED